jgi:hypothetical protein
LAAHIAATHKTALTEHRGRLQPSGRGAHETARVHHGYGGLAVTWPIAVRAQQRERMRRAELRRHSQSGEYQARKTAFLQLAQLGWIDGRNVRIDTRGALPMSTEFVKYATEMLGPCPVKLSDHASKTSRETGDFEFHSGGNL